MPFCPNRQYNPSLFLFNQSGALAKLVATLPSVIGKKPAKPEKKVKEKRHYACASQWHTRGRC